MGKVVKPKAVNWRRQRGALIQQAALRLPLLHHQLVETYGAEKGRKIYDELFETNNKRWRNLLKGKDVGEIMMAEIDLFPLNGWKIWIERRKEGGEQVYYEHLGKCPHLDATRATHLPDPCEIVCGMDLKMAKKHRIAKWQQIKHMPSGNDECCFRITPYTKRTKK